MSQFIDGKPPSRSPKGKTEWAAIWLISLFFGGMILAALFRDYSIYTWSVPLYAVSWIILLVVHEFGHALMARALGWRVDMVCIGTGKLLTTKNILGMRTEFRAIPLSGYAVPRPTDLIQPQFKSFLIYAAGPGIELVLIAIIWAFLGSDTLFSRAPILYLIGLQTFSTAAAVGALLNLIPFFHETEHGKSASDGMGMILSWQIPDEEFAARMDK